jgi:hypothetical protein
MSRVAPALLAVVLAVVATAEASTLIRGDVGNTPLTDPGWPAGAAALFNHPGRVAWWEGPPFGGGQWHSECRGDAKTLSAVLADFAALDAKIKRVVVHDGTGRSFWLNPNDEPEKRDAARIDWVFMVWQPANWEQLRKLPADLNPTGAGDAAPPAQIDVFTARINWADVDVPKGIEVVDQRLVAHGFTPEDGVVIEGKVTDLASGEPLAATARLQRVEPEPAGGYRYPIAAEAKAGADGRWVLTHAPAGWLRVVVEAEGFVPRVAGYARFDEEPRWHSYDCALARPGPVSGRVTDESGKPLPEVDVRLDNVEAASGAGRYETPDGYATRTDAEGRFQFDRAPQGTATVWVSKQGYCRPGLGLPITLPKEDVALSMLQAATIRVTVDFGDKARPGGYIVMIEPEGGEVVGSYGGSGNIDAENQVVFRNVPPGRYTLKGRPNPGSTDEETKPVAVELKGGEEEGITLKAK